ncbi:MAG: hypothetical protein A2491_05110, partial [Bacteroidetes bacterium RIFOXYC12_FULL_35_7]
ITKGDHSSFISTGVYIKPQHWNENKKEIRSSCPNSERIKNFLEHKLVEAKDVVLKKEVESKYSAPKTLKHAINGTSGVKFFAFADKFIKNYEEKGKIGTYNRFKAVLAKMKNFVEEESFTFDQMTVHFLKQYEEYLRNVLKNANNTVHANLKAIMRIIHEAVRDDVIAIEKNPFLKHKIKWQSTEKVFLTEEEIEALENLALEIGSMKYHHRNMYLFACHAGGIRISDLIQLKWENFTGNHILLSTQKTGSMISVKLPQKALAIIELYKSKDAKKDDFIFPFLDKSDNLKDPKILHTRISSITSYTNTDLKDLAKDAKIEKHIHFHTSRHTWATRALRKGMRIEYVSKLMGHNSIRTTQIYAKIVNADLDKAMEVFD